MNRELSSITSDLQDLLQELELISDTAVTEAIASRDRAIIHCLQLGLPLLEELFGHSSEEVRTVERIIKPGR